MITLYIKHNDPDCEGIEDVIDEMALAHRVIEVNASDETVDVEPPTLVDEEKVYQGRRAILEHLDQLRAYKHQWYKYQSDACYCDEEGNVE